MDLPWKVESIMPECWGVKLHEFSGHFCKTLTAAISFKAFRSVTFFRELLCLSPQASKLTKTGAMAKFCPYDSPFPALLSMSCALPSPPSIGQTI